MREVVIEPSEILRIGSLDVTAPLRTAVDLARFSPTFGDDERFICAGLMRLGRFGLEECRDSMESRRNLPNKKLAISRLATV